MIAAAPPQDRRMIHRRKILELLRPRVHLPRVLFDSSSIPIPSGANRNETATIRRRKALLDAPPLKNHDR
jgi:hypothetical protein